MILCVEVDPRFYLLINSVATILGLTLIPIM